MTLPAPKHSWKFDETSGTTAADSVGGAVVTLDSAGWVPGRQGNAIRFNPKDGVKRATTSLAELPPPWTAGLWVKREADSEGSALFSSPDYALKLEQWDSPQHPVGFTKFAAPGVPGFDTSFGYTAPLDQWVHLAVVATASELTLYVNGARQDSVNGSINLGLQWLGSSKGYVEFASAIFDEIQIFDVALSDEQVDELANGPAPSTSFRVLIHALGADWSHALENINMSYKAWDGSSWIARLSGDTFILAPGGDFTRAHSDATIAYTFWDGSHWLARVNGTTFTHAPDGDWSRAHGDTVLSYKATDGSNWALKIKE